MSTTEGTAMGWALRTGAAAELKRAASSRTLLDRLAVVFFAATFLAVSVYTFVRPDYNWDMVAYLATALEDRVSDPEGLHAATWAQVEAGAPEAKTTARPLGIAL